MAKAEGKILIEIELLTTVNSESCINLKGINTEDPAEVFLDIGAANIEVCEP